MMEDLNMDGNEAMADRIVFETEEQNNFQAEVYFYMQEHGCDEKTAVKAVEPLYR